MTQYLPVRPAVSTSCQHSDTYTIDTFPIRVKVCGRAETTPVSAPDCTQSGSQGQKVGYRYGKAVRRYIPTKGHTEFLLQGRWAGHSAMPHRRGHGRSGK